MLLKPASCFSTFSILLFAGTSSSRRDISFRPPGRSSHRRRFHNVIDEYIAFLSSLPRWLFRRPY
jgi:hypothetical protein